MAKSGFTTIRSVRRAAALALALGLLTAAQPGRAATPLGPAEQAMVTRAEAALNRIRDIQSRFIQSSSNGRLARGTLYVRRPGHLRIDYAPPTPLQIYADSTWLYYLDFELKEANQVPVGSTPAAFLIGDKVTLSGDLTVTGVDRRAGRVWLDVVRTADPDSGTLRIALDGTTLALQGWVVVDAQGVETHVNLVDPAFNKPIDDKVFVYSPPTWAFDSEETSP